MDFDYDSETITPDNTNLLTIGGSGGFELPLGNTAQRPITGLSNGALRYNTDITNIEAYVNNSWSALLIGAPSTTLTGDITGTGTGTIATTLATVNASPQTDTFRKITVNSKGLVTASSAVASSDIITSLGYTPVDRAGDTMTGPLSMGGNVISSVGTAVAGTDATNKNYVDALVTGLSWKQAARVATTTNGTLATSFANGQVVDGVTLVTGDRILIKNQTTQTENGLYIVQVSGAPVRATDADVGTDLVGASVFIDEGTVNADTGWTQTVNAPITIGSTNIVFAQFTGSGTYTAGAGLTLTGNSFSLTSPVSVTLGGTGLSAAPTNGQLLIGNGSGYTLSTVTASTGISVTNGAGSITIANTGVTSVAATQPTSGITITGSPITTIGTLAFDLANDLAAIEGLATTGLAVRTATDTWATRTITGTAGNIVITDGNGIAGNPVINLATTGTSGTYGVVTTDTFGRVTSGAAITPVLNGGTGLSATGTSNQMLGVNNAGTALEYKTMVAGAGITITHGANSVTIAATGGSLALYAENPSTPTTPTATGANAVAIGTNVQATAINSAALGSGAIARVYGERASSAGNFATLGDAQHGEYNLRNTTVNATETELFLDGTSARLVLPNNSAYMFAIDIVGRRTDATGGRAAFQFTGLIYRDANAATTAFQGTPSQTTIARSSGALDANVSADTTNGSLRITVVGLAAQTFRWSCFVRTQEVTN